MGGEVRAGRMVCSHGQQRHGQFLLRKFHVVFCILVEFSKPKESTRCCSGYRIGTDKFIALCWSKSILLKTNRRPKICKKQAHFTRNDFARMRLGKKTKPPGLRPNLAPYRLYAW